MQWLRENLERDARFFDEMKAVFRQYASNVQAAQRSELLDALTDRFSPEIIDQVAETYDDVAPQVLDRVSGGFGTSIG